ncbi:hypothetical protein MOQ67_05230 [Pseudomonas sp. LY-1]
METRSGVRLIYGGDDAAEKFTAMVKALLRAKKITQPATKEKGGAK